MVNEVTNKDILEAIGVFSNKVEGRLASIEENMTTKQDIDSLEQQLSVIQAKLDRALYTEVVAMEARITRLEQKVGIAAS